MPRPTPSAPRATRWARPRPGRRDQQRAVRPARHGAPRTTSTASRRRPALRSGWRCSTRASARRPRSRSRHHFDAATRGEVSYFLGTEVAGLIAGAARRRPAPVGFAPGTEIVDVRAYVDRGPTRRSRAVDAGAGRPGSPGWPTHARGAEHQGRRRPVRGATSPALHRRSRRCRRPGSSWWPPPATVPATAPSSRRPRAASRRGRRRRSPSRRATRTSSRSTPPATATRAAGAAVKNSRTTVAAPTYNAVSYGLNGHTCVVQPIATGAAAAEVTGVVALLWQMFPTTPRADRRPAGQHRQRHDRRPDPADRRRRRPALRGADPAARARRRATWSGRCPRPTRHPGHGAGARRRRAGQTRDDAVWWGLIGGGLLVVALMLRARCSARRRGQRVLIRPPSMTTFGPGHVAEPGGGQEERPRRRPPRAV